MASRLSENPHCRVLLLEAGESDAYHLLTLIPGAFFQLFNGSLDWRFKTETESGLGNRSLMWPRAKVLGGCSSMNAQIYTRGSKGDYDEWERRGCEGWGYSTMIQYFKRSQVNHDSQMKLSDYHGSKGEQSKIIAIELDSLLICQSTGFNSTHAPSLLSLPPFSFSLPSLSPSLLFFPFPLGFWSTSFTRSYSPGLSQFIQSTIKTGVPASNDLNGVSAIGVARFQTSTKNGWRHSSHRAFMVDKNVCERPNLVIGTSCHVMKILTSKIGDTLLATGVEFQGSDGEFLKTEALPEIFKTPTT